MTTPIITVLHVLGGVDFRGGAVCVTEKLAGANLPGVEARIWVHRECKQVGDAGYFVAGGRARRLNAGLARDLWAAIQDTAPLYAWCRTQQRVVLHAHSRAGIFAASIVHWLGRWPLVLHLQFLANRPALYRLLQRLTGATVIYNSPKTCRHYGGDPTTAQVLMPPITWPTEPPARRNGAVRFVAAGHFVLGKHFLLLVTAFRRLRQAGIDAELVIFGLSESPPDPACQRTVVQAAQGEAAIRLMRWSRDWAGQLTTGDIFVHVGEPESFGLVILEAFAKGSRLLVLRGTFLDDLPEALRSPGIEYLERLDEECLFQKMKLALRKVDSHSDFWEARRTMSHRFSVEYCSAPLAQLYHSLANPNPHLNRT